MTQTHDTPATSRPNLHIFVHLAHAFDVRHWEEARKSGSLIGFNARTPYGYHLAEEYGCRVQFSRGRREGLFGRTARLACRVILGFDLVHAWHNRREAMAADVIWTHTESQFLALAFLLMLGGRSGSPKLIGQAVWLIDRWPRLSPLHRALYRRLMQRVDVLTLHSPLNLARARLLFPYTQSELVLFGIPADEKMPLREKSPSSPLKVVAVGNDEHRDWDTLLSALGGREDCQLQIVSAAVKPGRAKPYANVRIGRLGTNAELRALYAEADLMVLPLKPNMHASGTTVTQEAALSGLPIIASDVGGLRAYFSDEAIRYVPPGDAQALVAAFQDLASDPDARRSLAECAAARMGPDGLSARAYIRRHVDLSHEILSGATGCAREPARAVALPASRLPGCGL